MLIVAAELGFKSCVGVEFADELAEVAARNVAASGFEDHRHRPWRRRRLRVSGRPLRAVHVQPVLAPGDGAGERQPAEAGRGRTTPSSTRTPAIVTCSTPCRRCAMSARRPRTRPACPACISGCRGIEGVGFIGVIPGRISVGVSRPKYEPGISRFPGSPLARLAAPDRRPGMTPVVSRPANRQTRRTPPPDRRACIPTPPHSPENPRPASPARCFSGSPDRQRLARAGALRAIS